jgi:hypothetical protein
VWFSLLEAGHGDKDWPANKQLELSRVTKWQRLRRLFRQGTFFFYGRATQLPVMTH